MVGSWFPSSSSLPANVITKPVARGKFRITINERGFLDSQRNETLTCEVPGSTTIISIVDEGVSVKEGDVVVELDSSSLQEKARQQEIDVTQAEAKLSTAKENLEIQKTQNTSDIAFVELSLELAELDYNKYIEGELPQERDKITGQIRLKEEQLARKRESYEFTKRLAKKGYRSQSDLEAERIAVTQAEIELRVEQENFRVLENFTSKRTIRELEADATEFVRELDRVKRQASAALSKAEAEYQSALLTLEVEKEKYNEWLQHIEFCTLKAPQDGQIVYANASSGSRRGGSSEPEIYEGATVRERQALLKIPDLTKMKIDARIHESMISKLDLGLPVIIRADAQPGEVFNGVVSQISSVPLSGSFPNQDIKEYQIAVNLTDPPERVRLLRPGISAEFEVVVDDRDNVLQIPVQAVVQVGRDYYAWVVKGKSVERRKIKVANSNDTDLELLEGVNQGENVIMSPRSLFADEITQLEEVRIAELAENGEDDSASDQSESPKPKAGRKEGADKPKGDRPAGGPGGGDPAAFFQRMDKDGDGALSKSELPEPMQAMFDTADSDSNGSLSLGEWKAVAAKRNR